MLAQKFGVALPELSEGSGDDAPAGRRLRESLLKAHEIAAAYFREQLMGPAGARARQQSKDRDVSPRAIDQLGLGFAPHSRDGLKSRLLSQGFAQGLLIQSGLLVQRDTGEVVDRFRNRLMVPICRDTGSVIAFGGRQMDADQGAEVSEFARDADLLEEPDALRTEPVEAGHSASSGSPCSSRGISTSLRCTSRAPRPRSRRAGRR